MGFRTPGPPGRESTGLWAGEVVHVGDQDEAVVVVKLLTVSATDLLLHCHLRRSDHVLTDYPLLLLLYHGTFCDTLCHVHVPDGHWAMAHVMSAAGRSGTGREYPWPVRGVSRVCTGAGTSTAPAKELAALSVEGRGDDGLSREVPSCGGGTEGQRTPGRHTVWTRWTWARDPESGWCPRPPARPAPCSLVQTQGQAVYTV